MTAEMPTLARAQALLMAHRPADALRELSTLSAGESTSSTAFLIRARALNALQQWAEAAPVARAGLEAAGPDPDLLGELSEALHSLGDLPAAERAILDALALEPTNVDNLCAYARLCTDAGQLNKATKLIEHAMAESPESAIVYATRIRLAVAYGRDAEATRISRDFVAAYPESPAAHAALGGTNALRGRVDPAYQGLRQAAAGAPTIQEFAEAAMDARTATHPLLWPLRPIERFGPIKIWLAVLVVLFGLRAARLPGPALVVGLTWVLYCVYSWVVPPIVRRRARRRWR